MIIGDADLDAAVSPQIDLTIAPPERIYDPHTQSRSHTGRLAKDKGLPPTSVQSSCGINVSPPADDGNNREKTANTETIHEREEMMVNEI